MRTKEFSLKARIRSFRFAFDGARQFFRQEHNAWIHLAATILVFGASWYYQLSYSEFVLLLIVTGFVWTAEIFNTAIEKLADFLYPQKHESVKYVKDLAAAAVLVAAVIALVTGAIIFIPKIF
ncbi:MAG: diacylglycerol kinase family protein [Chitinophagaceae bacterium]|nr:diacylglycerol kinase family protein [Chitinophagaceae bacterium]